MKIQIPIITQTTKIFKSPILKKINTKNMQKKNSEEKRKIQNGSILMLKKLKKIKLISKHFQIKKKKLFKKLINFQIIIIMILLLIIKIMI